MIVQHSVELSEHRISDLIAMNPIRKRLKSSMNFWSITVGAEDSSSFGAFVERA